MDLAKKTQPPFSSLGLFSCNKPRRLRRCAAGPRWFPWLHRSYRRLAANLRLLLTPSLFIREPFDNTSSADSDLMSRARRPFRAGNPRRRSTQGVFSGPAVHEKMRESLVPVLSDSTAKSTPLVGHKPQPDLRPSSPCQAGAGGPKREWSSYPSLLLQTLQTSHRYLPGPDAPSLSS